MQSQLGRLSPGYPSLTFPSHATMATGVSALQHGVMQNKIDPKLGLPIKSKEDHDFYIGLANRLKAPPIWLLAKNKGVEVFIHSWAMSLGKWCGHDIRDNPEEPYSAERARMPVVTSEIINKLTQWRTESDLLIYSYSNGIDAEGHLSGPYGTPVLKRWQEVKASLLELVGFIGNFNRLHQEQVDFFVVSDHGMYEDYASQGFALMDFLREIQVPTDALIRHNKAAFKFVDYEPSDIQKRALVGEFNHVVNDKGETVYHMKNSDFVLSSGNLKEACKAVIANRPHHWMGCNIFTGGHHRYKFGVDPKLYDGVFWNVTSTSVSRIVTQQTDIVPIVSDLLGIDLAMGENYNSCALPSQPFQNR